MNSAEKAQCLARPELLSDARIVDSVRSIIDAVQRDGDAALYRYTKQFDRADLDSFSVPLERCAAAWDNLDEQTQNAMQTAFNNIEKFHAAQKPAPIKVETMPGITCHREPRPLQSCGLYIPGGTAPLISTVMMLAVPAKIANVKQRILVSPPGPDGNINAGILAAAYLCGVSQVFACGGAQAIAALAYGTESIPKCDKIFGPGNAYVAAAKSMVSQQPGGPAIDLPAGPSEAMVIADRSTNPVFAASDLLSQAEHDVMAQVLCICDIPETAERIKREVSRQVATLPRREIAEAALENARIIIAENDVETLEIVNDYAPEHLIIQTNNPDRFVKHIDNTGSIFLGPWTPESVGDYASGTNHTLPTNGAAKAYSGVTLESFYKYISIQHLTLAGFETLAPTVERLAEMEELEAHKRAVSLRMNEIRQ